MAGYIGSKAVSVNTTSATITGDASIGGDLSLGDNDKIILGAGSDLQIFHDGSNSYITDGGTGNLRVQADDLYVFNAAGNSVMISALDDGKVGLGFAGSEKLATTNTGIAVTGAISASSGDVTITDGNLVVASGHGIDFAATGGPTAGSGSSELFDDYEEGTWTPTIFGTDTAGTYSLESARTGGIYTKIGRTVYVSGVLRIASITSAGAGTLNIGGFPYVTGANPAASWGDGFNIQLTHYGAGSNSSVGSYPPPFVATGNSGASSYKFNSYGKNYKINSNIVDLSANNWIYQFSGFYDTTS